jgi:hypothetical protein
VGPGLLAGEPGAAGEVGGADAVEFLALVPGDACALGQPLHRLAAVHADHPAVVGVVGLDGGDPPGDPGFDHPVEGRAGAFVDRSFE